MLTISPLVTLLMVSAVSAASTFDKRQSGNKPTQPIIEFVHPADRGWNADTLTIGPCQGYKLSGRMDYPLSGGQFSLLQTRDAKQVQISYSTLADPQLVSDFAPLMPNLTHTFSGSSCLPAPDLTTLGLRAGQDVTFKLEFFTGPRNSTHYHCADVRLVEAATYQRPTYSCTNVTETTRTTRDSAANSNLAKAPADPLQLAEAGGIGAGVTLAVIGLVILALWKLGFAAFGKNAIQKRKWEAEAHELEGDRKSITAKSVDTGRSGF